MLRALRPLHFTSSRVLSLPCTHILSHPRWFASIGPVEYQKQHEIKVKDCDIAPVEEFSGLPFPENLQSRLSQAFPAPTPIQAQTWPIAVTGRDMIGIARTGSGKTLAYLLPGFLKVKASKAKRTPKILVLVPTRELAVQIHKESSDYGRQLGIKTVAVYGGVSKFPQAVDLQKGCDVIVGTPGRLNDFLEESVLDLADISYLVLDEADRMLDMGFEPQISSIIRDLGDHQTMMFTATWPTEVQDLASEYLNNPAQVRIGHAAGSDLVLPKTIKHEVFNVTQREKQKKLLEIIGQRQRAEAKSTFLVFANTKLTCDILSNRLKEHDRRCGTLHGDISQFSRQRTIDDLRSNRTNIVVATDVAARGLDISNITDVINYDFPQTVQDWIHRVGRTGRAGRDGIAHTLFEPSRDVKNASLLAKVIRDAGQDPPEWLVQLASSPSPFASFRRGGSGGSSYSRSSTLRSPRMGMRRAFEDFKSAREEPRSSFRPRPEGSALNAFRRRGPGEGVLSAGRMGGRSEFGGKVDKFGGKARRRFENDVDRQNDEFEEANFEKASFEKELENEWGEEKRSRRRSSSAPSWN